MTITVIVRHLGPGPHPAGSPQSVHGKKGMSVHEDAPAYNFPPEPPRIGANEGRPENAPEPASDRPFDLPWYKDFGFPSEQQSQAAKFMVGEFGQDQSALSTETKAALEEYAWKDFKEDDPKLGLDKSHYGGPGTEYKDTYQRVWMYDLINKWCRGERIFDLKCYRYPTQEARDNWKEEKFTKMLNMNDFVTPKLIDQIDAGLKHKLSRDVVVYRGTNVEHMSKLSDGDVYQDAGYLSTSLGQGVARLSQFNRKAIFRILLPRGSECGTVEDTEKLKKFPNTVEAEIVLPRNSRLRVVSHTVEPEALQKDGKKYDVTVYNMLYEGAGE